MGKCILCALAMGLGSMALADSIVIDGKVYEEVLVYESPRLYYVTLPEEGQAFSVEKGRVDAASVEIVKSPSYRSRLTQLYEQNRGIAEGAGRLPDVEVADREPVSEEDLEDMAAASAEVSGEEAPAGQGVDQPGLGVSVQQVQTALSEMNVTLQPAGQNTWSAQAPDGSVQLQVSGREDNLSMMTASAQGQMAQLGQHMGALSGVMGQVAPWLPQWIQESQTQLMQSGQASTQRDGVAVNVSGGMQGQTINVTVTVQAVG